MDLLAISGSLRRASFNTALLRALAQLAPDGVRIEIATLDGIPLYDGDVEAASGVPAAAAALREKIAAAPGVIVASPEYNHSIPGVLKNAIDWCSRPTTDIARVFGGRPVGLVGASPGGGGARLAHAACLSIVDTLGMIPWLERSLLLGHARQVFDAAGALTDEKVKAQAAAWVAGFAAFVARIAAAPPG
jgi:chromate reductase